MFCTERPGREEYLVELRRRGIAFPAAQAKAWRTGEDQVVFRYDGSLGFCAIDTWAELFEGKREYELVELVPATPPDCL